MVSQLHALLERTGKLDKNHVKEIAGWFARVGLRQSLEHTPWDDLSG